MKLLCLCSIDWCDNVDQDGRLDWRSTRSNRGRFPILAGHHPGAETDQRAEFSQRPVWRHPSGKYAHTFYVFFTVCWNRVTTTPTRDLISLDGAFRGRRRKETDDNPIGVPRCCFLVRPITARPILHHFSLLHLFPFARHLAICKWPFR